MSTPTTPVKRTPGEELWKVHLRRTNSPHHDHEDDEDDHDYEVPRKRSRSIGEELFDVFLKRSQGVDLDRDVPKDSDADAAKSSASNEKDVRNKNSSSDATKDEQDGDDGMHLRDGRVVAHRAQ
mmetsp:Transcript_35411/g.77569  ORF Transcript_35411/g.77569 Transcript_35411/m.77569 type:complete len:124 (+) Transcript_35411:163-534(+)